MVTIVHAGRSDRGLVRERNEDNWSADPEAGLYVVSDGMGGHHAGALAAQIVVETLPAMVRKYLPIAGRSSRRPIAPRLASTLRALSDRVRRESRGQVGLDGMGATVVLVLIRGERAWIAHMGDSRAYLLRDGRLKQLTTDHSIVQLLIDSGDISPEQAATHPARGQVTRSVGMEGEPLPEVREVRLREGDRLLLCTDGLSGMVAERRICEVLAEHPGPPEACQALIAAANAAGGCDNVTAVVVRVDPAARVQSGTARDGL